MRLSDSFCCDHQLIRHFNVSEEEIPVGSPRLSESRAVYTTCQSYISMSYELIYKDTPIYEPTQIFEI